MEAVAVAAELAMPRNRPDRGKDMDVAYHVHSFAAGTTPNSSEQSLDCDMPAGSLGRPG